MKLKSVTQSIFKMQHPNTMQSKDRGNNISLVSKPSRGQEQGTPSFVKTQVYQAVSIGFAWCD